MTQPNPYAPPRVKVDDASLVERRAPRLFIALLIFYFTLEVLSAVLTRNYIGLSRVAIIGIAAWRTLQGGRAASRFLGGLFALGAVLSLWSAFVTWGASPANAMGALVVGVLLGTLAAYTFLSPAMHALYVEGDRTRWRGR